MNPTRTAALVHAVASACVAAFQLALAAGAPWGSLAMGGAYPGQMPTGLRAAAVVQAALLLLMAGIVLARAGLALPGWSAASRRLVWIVVAFGFVGFVLNVLTPSASERALWAPVAFVLLACSLRVAMPGYKQR